MKILYVEDEIFLGKIVKESLETKGFNVLMESDGANALEQFKKFNPSVCILDIMLPNKSGFEIAIEIRKINFQVPIIFLTAKTQTSDVVEGFKIGANDYIRKPFSVEELIARIYNVTKNNNASQNNNHDDILFGEFILQVNKQILNHKTNNKKLSYRETALLKMLIQSNGEIINRADILLSIWGSDSSFNSRNLDVYITKIRGYLKEDTSIEIITVKGIGYRFLF